MYQNAGSVASPLLTRICLWTAVCLGVMMFFPVPYFLPLVLAITLTPVILYAALAANLRLKLDRRTAEICILLVLWLAYSLISFFWIREIRPARDFTLNILIYLLLFLIFSQLFHRRQFLLAAPLPMQMIFYAYCLVYLWEMLTWNHLPSSRLHQIPLPVPTGVYFNENNSAVTLMLLAPFLTIRTRLTSGRVKGFIALAMFLVMLLATFIQNSRLVLACLAVLSLYFFIRSRNLTRLAAVAMVVFGVYFFISQYPQEYKAVRLLVNRELKITSRESESYYKTSAKVRARLNEESVSLAAESALFGTGSGSYEEMLSRNRFHRTYWVIFAHNWWLELLADFGLPAFLLACYIYLRWLIKLWKLRQIAAPEDFAFYDACFLSLLLFLPLSIIPSTIRAFYHVWVYFAFINAVCLTRSVSLRADVRDATTPIPHFQ